MAIISAEPTKEFFISMLTRDISLLSALVDLIDNSVDAALASGSYQEKIVELNLNRESFSIKDNCGGISRVAAEEYAFKFGRPITAPNAPHSVGRFGVGMKRALFKMGTDFKIESNHNDGAFEIDVDVQNWMSSPDEWSFTLSEKENVVPSGTIILVNNLHRSISEKFEDDVFINTLMASIGKAHYKAINEGLEIKVNGIVVNKRDIKIKFNDELGVAGVQLNIDGVDITIKAGVGERDYHEGGWYVFCNGRMIEGANKGTLTGWGTDGIRTYHADVAFFRGAIEFNSVDGGKLPWNTTKTGIDSDNPLYRTALVNMKAVMRKVVELLKDRVKEQEALDQGRIEVASINCAINIPTLQSIFGVDVPQEFLRPNANVIPRKITKRSITYLVKEDVLNEVKESLGVTTNKDVGLLTFNYYRDNEC
jgi:hypothetical protein